MLEEFMVNDEEYCEHIALETKVFVEQLWNK